MPNSNSFTLSSNSGLLPSLITKCGICQGFDPSTGNAQPQIFKFDAIWDTGATSTVITQKVVDACGLQPIGMVRVHGVNSSNMSERYLVNVLLPNNIGFMHIPVIKGALPDGSGDVLIGMDLITQGDFSITNVSGQTIFSFRTPSMKRVDFVKDHQADALRESFTHGGSKKKRKKKPKKNRKSNNKK